MSIESPMIAIHDFNFLLGKWKVRNKRLKACLAACEEWETGKRIGLWSLIPFSDYFIQ